MKELITILNQMRNKTVNNYVIAGLRSSMIGGDEYGCVRLFEQERFQQDFICPHNHRFDFTCLVLEGSVINRQWRASNRSAGDLFQEKRLTYTGEIGKYSESLEEKRYYTYSDEEYVAGDYYGMTHDVIHSIEFGRKSKVLFFEGAHKSDSSIILNPIVDGTEIEFDRVDDWMFSKSTVK